MPAKQVVTVKKPYCKVCHDAGKDESIYTSHYVRSDPGPNGKIICPTLLAVKCSYCFKEGHTSSHCQILIKNKKQLAKDVAKKNYLNNEKEKSNYSTSKSSNKKNSFECLLEEVENKKKSLVKKIVKEEFPALSSKPTITKNDFTISYANIAKTAHEKEVKEEIMTEILSIIYKSEEPPKKPKIVVAKKEKEVKLNWADYSSSDDEDEEEELMTASEYYKEYMEDMSQNDAW